MAWKPWAFFCLPTEFALAQTEREAVEDATVVGLAAQTMKRAGCRLEVLPGSLDGNSGAEEKALAGTAARV